MQCLIKFQPPNQSPRTAVTKTNQQDLHMGDGVLAFEGLCPVPMLLSEIVANSMKVLVLQQ